MNLYLLSQNANNGYDTHDSCVVVAESEDVARLISPSGDAWDEEWTTWAYKPEQVVVTYLGTAEDTLKSGDIICSSFNAG